MSDTPFVRSFDELQGREGQLVWAVFGKPHTDERGRISHRPLTVRAFVLHLGMGYGKDSQEIVETPGGVILELPKPDGSVEVVERTAVDFITGARQAAYAARRNPGIA